MPRIFLFSITILFGFTITAQNDSSLIIFIHANLIDGISDKPLENVDITIRNGKIASVEKHIKEYKEGIVIDLSGKWVLPGFIDAHAHFLTFDAARRALTTGVTTARTLRCDHFVDIQIRTAHHQGQLDLPDIVAAGYHIRPDMSQAFYEDFPGLKNMGPKLNGVENVRRAVRAEINRQVDFVKILVSEKAGNPNADPLKRTFTDEEIEAIIDEAKKSNIPVAAHAYGDQAAAAAVRYGVRSIEHGAFITDTTLNLMKRHGTYLDPTMAEWVMAFERVQRYPDFKVDPVMRERYKNFSSSEKAVVMKAYRMGIPIIGGTDSEYSDSLITQITDEAIALSAIGIPQMDAIKSITTKSAECLLISDRTGSIKPGLDADILVVDQNPLVKIEALKNILLIVNDGRIVLNRL